jgi:hypothetical protein
MALRKMWDDLGIDVPHYYVDVIDNVEVCHW